jgi:hypothetical protein
MRSSPRVNHSLSLPDGMPEQGQKNPKTFKTFKTLGGIISPEYTEGNSDVFLEKCQNIEI